jgi:hypothetical protein
VNLHEVLNDLYLRNGCKRRLANDFPLFPSKTLSDDPQIKSVGAAVPEIQLGLCKGSGTGVGAKTVQNVLYSIWRLRSNIHLLAKALSAIPTHTMATNNRQFYVLYGRCLSFV